MQKLKIQKVNDFKYLESIIKNNKKCKGKIM